jgi:hypothetical protein
MIVTTSLSLSSLSRRLINLASSVVCDSLRDLILLMPESALDSLRFRTGAYWLPVSLDVRPHGKLLAKSANVSRRFRGGLVVRFEPPPLHSLKISVNCARELRLRL